MTWSDLPVRKIILKVEWKKELMVIKSMGDDEIIGERRDEDPGENPEGHLLLEGMIIISKGCRKIKEKEDYEKAVGYGN